MLTSRVARLPDADIDTDVIFPARFLLITEKTGLGRYAFLDKRFQNGIERDDFPLRPGLVDPPRILVTGDNFGCGSSREQAVWALHDLGVRCILSTSFGEIFQSNCFKSGVLPIALPPETLSALASEAILTIDLIGSEIIPGNGRRIPFQIQDWRREALIHGWDDVSTLINTKSDAIAAFEATRRYAAPWLFRPLSERG